VLVSLLKILFFLRKYKERLNRNADLRIMHYAISHKSRKPRTLVFSNENSS